MAGSGAVMVVPSDLYPALRRFLEETGLQRTLKAFEKETGADAEDPDAAPVPKAKKKLAKRLATMELTDACKCWLDAHAATPSVEKVEEGAVKEVPNKNKEKKKEKDVEAGNTEPNDVQAAEVAAEAAPAAEEKPKKKRKRSSVEAESAPAEPAVESAPAGGDDAAADDVQAPPKKKGKAAKEEKKSGVPFKRVDDAKWTATIADDRLKDNTHKAKNKFGLSAGDSWGDKAAEDMLKVKGKGFRKEMAKKKRASWKGAGELDQGVNSIKFDGSSDDEDEE